MSVKIICIGKIKDSDLLNLEAHYLKQLNQLKLEIVELKSFGEDVDKEMKYLDEVLKKEKNVWLLTESGKTFDSPTFAEFLSANNQTFVISGAVGFGQEFKKMYPKHLSLSALTFPHKLARLLLVEQIYRAQSILNNHPYHN